MEHKRHINPLYEAWLESKKSLMKNKHGCVIVNNGEIIARGCNKYRYGNTKLYKDSITRKGCTIHAEIDAIMKCDKQSLRGAVLYVVRFDRKNEGLMYSAPCHNCEKVLSKLIEKNGLRKVYFSTDLDMKYIFNM